jgi:hypothetical protein
MLFVIPLLPQGVGKTEVIDGVTYRPLQIDASDGIYVTPIGHWAPSSIGSGHVTVLIAGLGQAFPSQACKAVAIRALISNTGTIYVGTTGVHSSTGYELSAGDAIDIAIDDLSKVSIDSSVNGEGVSYLWVS